MRLIDADVLKQHIDKLPALPDGNFAGNHSALKALINMQPTIESSTNCSEIQNSSDCISRQAAIETVRKCAVKEVTPAYMLIDKAEAMTELMMLPSAQPETKPIGYQECANAMLKMWIDNVVTDGEYSRIMDKLNSYWRRTDG